MELWRVTPLSQDKFLGNYIHKYKFRAEKALWEKWPSFTRGSPLPSKSPSQNISPWRRALTGKTPGAGSAVSSPAFSFLAGPPCALRLWSSLAQELQLSGSVAPRMWGLCPLTRDWTRVLCVAKQTQPLGHQEIPSTLVFYLFWDHTYLVSLLGETAGDDEVSWNKEIWGWGE